MALYTYHINLDERGNFYADVRDADDKTVHEIHDDEETGEIWEIESGYMRHARDLAGLQKYLASLGVMKDSDVLAGAA